jgi:ABC-type transporter Mla subunit MlaD
MTKFEEADLLLEKQLLASTIVAHQKQIEKIAALRTNIETAERTLAARRQALQGLQAHAAEEDKLAADILSRGQAVLPPRLMNQRRQITDAQNDIKIFKSGLTRLKADLAASRERRNSAA